MPVIRRERQVFASAIGVASMDTGGADLANVVAGEADRLSGMVFKLAAEDAEESGTDLAQAMEEGVIKSIDPETGMPTALKQPAGGRIARKAYERVIDKRFQEAMDRDLRLASKRIAMDNPSPGAYKAAFSSYIAGLGENAVGKYGEFVKSTGSALLASTELTLQARARSAARAGAGRARAAASKEAAAFLYAMGKEGMTDQAVELLSIQSGVAKDELEAGLLDPATMSQLDGKLKGALAEGTTLRVMTDLRDDEAGLNAVATAISSGGLIMEGVPDDVRGDVELIVGLSDVSNMAAISGEASRLGTALNRQRAAAEEALADEEARNARLALVEAQTDMVSFENEVAKSAASAASEALLIAENVGPNYASVYSTPSSTQQAARISANMNATADVLSTKLDAINQSFVDGDLSETHREEQRKGYLEAWAAPYARGLASLGNVDALSAAVDGDPAAMADLLPEQRQMLSALMSTEPARLNNEIVSDALKETFAKGEMSAREAQEQTVEMFQWRAELSSSENVLKTGTFGTDRSLVEELTLDIAQRVQGGSLTDVQGAALLQQVNDAWSIGLVNAASTAKMMDSRELSAMQEYLLSHGGRIEPGLSQTGLNAANAILSASGGNLSAVKSHITSLRERRSKAEAEIESAREEQAQLTAVASGQGRPNSASDRKAAQGLIEQQFGVDLRSPDSVSDAVYQRIESIGIVPENVFRMVERLSQGNPGPDSAIAIQHYANLSEVERNGRPINLFRGTMADEHIALMDSVLTISQQTGEAPEEILAVKFDDTHLRDVKIDEMFPKGAADFVRETIGRKAGTYTTSRLAPVAQYLAEKGFSLDEVKHYIEGDFDEMFMKSDFVVDPDIPLGNAFRTDMAPERLMNEPELDAMIDIIGGDLPPGYHFGRNRKGFLGIGGDQPGEGQKPVYMVPDKTSGRDAGIWELFTVDDYGQLTPLIYEKDGQPFWPRFNMRTDPDFLAFQSGQRADVLREGRTEAEEARQLRLDALDGLARDRERMERLLNGEVLDTPLTDARPRS